MSRKFTENMSFRQRVLRQARAFLLRGFLVLPIPAGRKAPRLKGWTELRLKKQDLEGAFGPSDNLGVILGAPSGGLVDVDLDCHEAFSLARSFLPPSIVGSARGKRRSIQQSRDYPPASEETLGRVQLLRR